MAYLFHKKYKWNMIICDMSEQCFNKYNPSDNVPGMIIWGEFSSSFHCIINPLIYFYANRTFRVFMLRPFSNTCIGRTSFFARYYVTASPYLSRSVMSAQSLYPDANQRPVFRPFTPVLNSVFRLPIKLFSRHTLTPPPQGQLKFMIVCKKLNEEISRLHLSTFMHRTYIWAFPR